MISPNKAKGARHIIGFLFFPLSPFNSTTQQARSEPASEPASQRSSPWLLAAVITLFTLQNKQRHHVQDNNRHTNNHLCRIIGIHLSCHQGSSQISLGWQGIWLRHQRRASTRCHRDEECIEGIRQLEWCLGWIRRRVRRVRYGRWNAFETVSTSVCY